MQHPEQLTAGAISSPPAGFIGASIRCTGSRARISNPPRSLEPISSRPL
ncbi:hypothetical protein IE991_09110 [Klebsiella pneumoniae]|uniref:Uncharacterized protein n=1 Tax=Klebsiella pneumoniae TaxID=573 RepID=A0A927DCA4_KLEPN|nr:hypothetical protein [Klebsiella pneumoniae]